MKLPRKGMGKFASAIIGLVGIIMWWGAIPIQSQVLGQHWGLNYLYFYKFKEKLKARALPAIDKRFVFSKGDSILPAPTVTHPSGFYDRPFSVTLLNGGKDWGDLLYA